MDLSNKVAILTGASRGLGTYMAEALARRGAHLALAARSAEDLERTAAQVGRFGVKVATIPTDVTKRADLKALVKRTNEELGPPDVLVNNAAVEQLAQFEAMALDEIAAIITTNVIALELLTRLVVPDMIERKRGHIVNIASMAGKTAVPYNTVYSSSKHAVVGFSWSLREELRPHQIGVSVVCPTFVSDSGMFTRWSSGTPPAIARAVTPEKVAAATIAAIEKNRAEILVTTGLGRVVDVMHAISPELTTSSARRFGLYDFLHKGAMARKGPNS